MIETADDALAVADRFGVFFAAVIILVVVVVPILRNNLWRKNEPDTAEAVADALLKRDVSDLRKQVDEHEERLDALEKKPVRRS